MALKKTNPEILDKAETLLFIPDYLNYLLTGVIANEFSIASTSGLLDARTKDWDYSIIKRLGLPKGIFQRIAMPGTKLGPLKDDVAKRVGFKSTVSLPASHDTGSAVAAVPDLSGDAAYISSGTWSLMGSCLDSPNTSKEALRSGFTNEGGYGGQIRLLKNIMGLWIIQEVSRELEDRYSFAELCQMAEKETISSIVECNDGRFLAPASMIQELKSACEESGQKPPETPGELAAVVYNSLAVCYGENLKILEGIAGKKFDSIRVVGGGSNADYLNRLTALRAGVPVFAGPSEATAIGNIAVQMMSDGMLLSLNEAKEIIGKSFEVKRFNP
jgi:rhamnulokinase